MWTRNGALITLTRKGKTRPPDSPGLRLAVALAASFALLALSPHAFAAIPQTERDALLALYNATDGDNWDNNTGWNGDVGTECDWAGISCNDEETAIASIALSRNNLAGTIPSNLGSIANLKTLDLIGNQLSGPIPATLGNLSSLKRLSLHNNQLTGSIPSALGDLSNLRELRLANNQLTGAIPSELGKLENMLLLWLHGNQLTGAIPSELVLTDLDGITLGHNALHSDDGTLLTFLNSIHPDGNLMATQTLDANGTVSTETGETKTTLRWNSVDYTQTGGYRVYLGEAGQSSYARMLEVPDKTITSTEVTELKPCTEYAAQVRSYTAPYDVNHSTAAYDATNNELESDGQTGDIATFTTACPDNSNESSGGGSGSGGGGPLGPLMLALLSGLAVVRCMGSARTRP